MKTKNINVLCIFFYLLVSIFFTHADTTTLPLERAHSHNDYFRKQPLWDALQSGFCSVEADIYPVNGDLLVAHDLDKCKPEKNLNDMYLKPLMEQVEKNNGHVYKIPSKFWLLIDIKNEPEVAYSLLKKQLEPYKKYLTRIEKGEKVEGAITIVISGSVPREIIEQEMDRYVFIDGRIQDLETNPSPDLVPWISIPWFSLFTWMGTGKISENELSKLKELIAKVHEQGRLLRFWGAPQTKDFWEVLYNEGVDLLNTDFPDRLSEFLQQKMKTEKAQGN